MARKILIGLALVIAAFLVLVATRPPTFHVERSQQIAAAPELVFSQVNDFRAWSRWSPWEKLDPNLQRSFSGAEQGRGAVYGWTGNDQVGEGRMTIQKSAAPREIVIKLEFLKPWTATNTATFTFGPVGSGTKVTWAMDGPSNFMSKAISLFMDMDKMIGDDFARGLANMKTVVEKPTQP